MGLLDELRDGGHGPDEDGPHYRVLVLVARIQLGILLLLALSSIGGYYAFVPEPLRALLDHGRKDGTERILWSVGWLLWLTGMGGVLLGHLLLAQRVVQARLVYPLGIGVALIAILVGGIDCSDSLTQTLRYGFWLSAGIIIFLLLLSPALPSPVATETDDHDGVVDDDAPEDEDDGTPLPDLLTPLHGQTRNPDDDVIKVLDSEVEEAD